MIWKVGSPKNIVWMNHFSSTNESKLTDSVLALDRCMYLSGVKISTGGEKKEEETSHPREFQFCVVWAEHCWASYRVVDLRKETLVGNLYHETQPTDQLAFGY